VTERHQSRVLISALYPLTDVAKIFWLNPKDKYIPTVGDYGWLDAFALLVPASLPLSS
jgi:hypothetical protein